MNNVPTRCRFSHFLTAFACALLHDAIRTARRAFQRTGQLPDFIVLANAIAKLSGNRHTAEAASNTNLYSRLQLITVAAAL